MAGPNFSPGKAMAQYLSRHAEPEAEAADRLEGEFGHALQIPAYGETESLFGTLASVPAGPLGEVLIVVVLNARADSPPEVHGANRTAREKITSAVSSPRVISSDSAVSVFPLPLGKLVLIDRALPGRFLPKGQGVGLARKIGCDFLLRLHATGRLASPWIHCTDADTLLPNDYFDQLRGRDDPEEAAAIYFFEHRFEEDPTLAEAARLYEISLRYYVLGLAWADSPYAYQSMGSCLAIRPAAYAEVRGFPKRNAAEDFYVLDKLAKVGRIARLAGSPLQLEGRISTRVPFGTGKALSDLVSKRRGLESFRLYHPAVFAHIAAWLRVLAAIARSGGRMQGPLGQFPEGSPFFQSDLLQDALATMGSFEAVREAIGKSKDEPTLLRHLHTWFDAFRTLKLVHALRDGGLPSLPWREALAEAPFTNLTASTEEDPEKLRKILAEEERKLAEMPAGVPAVEPERA